MKHFLFILGLLVSAMLFVPEDEAKSIEQAMLECQETYMEEDEQSTSQRNFEVLSKELKSCNFLTPRRVSQTTAHTFQVRVWKNLEKHLQDLRLKGENKLLKVYQHTSTDYIVFLSTLTCRVGEHVYALRKLII